MSWKVWKRSHRKLYANAVEEARRFQTFQDNLFHANEQGKAIRLDERSDLLPEERRTLARSCQDSWVESFCSEERRLLALLLSRLLADFSLSAGVLGGASSVTAASASAVELVLCEQPIVNLELCALPASRSQLAPRRSRRRRRSPRR